MRQEVYSKGKEMHNENERSVILKDEDDHDAGRKRVTEDEERVSI